MLKGGSTYDDTEVVDYLKQKEGEGKEEYLNDLLYIQDTLESLENYLQSHLRRNMWIKDHKRTHKSEYPSKPTTSQFNLDKERRLKTVDLMLKHNIVPRATSVEIARAHRSAQQRHPPSRAPPYTIVSRTKREAKQDRVAAIKAQRKLADERSRRDPPAPLYSLAGTSNQKGSAVYLLLHLRPNFGKRHKFPGSIYEAGTVHSIGTNSKHATPSEVYHIVRNEIDKIII